VSGYRRMVLFARACARHGYRNGCCPAPGKSWVAEGLELRTAGANRVLATPPGDKAYPPDQPDNRGGGASPGDAGKKILPWYGAADRSG